MLRKYLTGVMLLAFIMISVGTGTDAIAASSTPIYKSADKVYKVIKEKLIAHESTFTIKMDTKTMDKIGRNNDPFEPVVAIDDKSTSKDSDYLYMQLDSWNWKWTWNPIGTTASLTFSPVYQTTLKQEQKVDTQIASALKSLNLKGKSDYSKVKTIHDYIIKRVSYDMSYQKHTAYDALIGKSAVCQGYASLAYRMFTDAGIDCRIITGTADGGSHAWNIVKVNGKWYNIDLTWDDPVTSTGKQILIYDYFLKSNKDFRDHLRDTQYNTADFLAKYPIAAASYKK